MGWMDAPIDVTTTAAPAQQPALAASGWASAPIVAPPTPVYSGSILPFSRYSDGSVGFDSNAGIIGSIKNAFTLPGDVATGKVDPTSDEGIGRTLNMAATLSPVNPAVTAGDMALPGALSAFKPGTTVAPTADALHAAGGAGFDAARDMGVEYSSQHVAALAQGLQSDLNGDGIMPVLAPKTHALLDALQAVPTTPSTVPFGNLDAARKAFNKLTQEFTNPSEQAAASRAKDAITGFVANPDPAAVVAGPAADAASAVKDAIANSAAGFRSDRINGIEDAAGLRASAANSGANIGNSTRQRVASLLLNDKASSGYNPDELAALRGVTKGTAVSNTARVLGNLLGGGGGMHGAMTGVTGIVAGHEAGGLPGAIAGAALPVVGWGAKALDNSLTTGRLSAADELVRQRSPLYQALSAQTPPELSPMARRAALMRAFQMTAPPSPDQNSGG